MFVSSAASNELYMLQLRLCKGIVIRDHESQLQVMDKRFRDKATR